MSSRRPHSPSDSDHNDATLPPRKPKSREIPSRYLSTKRSPSIERKRPSTPRTNDAVNGRRVVTPVVLRSDGGAERWRQGGGFMSRSVDFTDGGKNCGGRSRNVVRDWRGVLGDEMMRSELSNVEGSERVDSSVERNVRGSVRKSIPERRRVATPMPVGLGRLNHGGGLMTRSGDFTDERKRIGGGSRKVVRVLEDSMIDKRVGGWDNDKEVDQGAGCLVEKNELSVSVTMRKSTPEKRRVTNPTSARVGGVWDKQPRPGRLRQGGGFMISSVDLYDERKKSGSRYVISALQVLYNRQMQWHFVNAKADAALSAQTTNTERSICSTWISTSKLHQHVRAKRMELQLLRQYVKLMSILKGQIFHLEEWALMDEDFSSSLLGATEALRASTLRLPVASDARVDVQKVKGAVNSAVDVMQAMASSISTLMSKAEKVNPIVAELAKLAAQEHGLLYQCKDLLSTAAAFQVKECSLRTHILQERWVSS